MKKVPENEERGTPCAIPSLAGFVDYKMEFSGHAFKIFSFLFP